MNLALVLDSSGSTVVKSISQDRLLISADSPNSKMSLSPTSTQNFGLDRVKVESNDINDSIDLQYNDDDYTQENETSNVSSTSVLYPPISECDSIKELKHKQSGVFGASSNLVNSIVGAGIIGIPYAINQSGLWVGILMLLLVGYLTDKSLRVIVECASFSPHLRNKNVTTFEDLMAYPFGSLGSGFILLNMFIMAYGAMVAYLLIIKDTVPTILGFDNENEGSYEREIILLATSLTIMVPLSLQKDMASLAFTSVLSVSADVILVFFILIFSPIKETVSENGGLGNVMVNDTIKPTFFIGLGILSTAMACQHSAFIVFGSLRNSSKKRWKRVTNWSIGISVVLCMVLGVSGYLGFMEETQGDVLNNFEAGSIAANGARGLLAITMLFTYPMESFVGRHVLASLIFKGDMDSPSSSWCRFCPSKREGLALCLYVLALIPAFIFDDLGPVLSITGSLGGSCISYIAPGLVYLGVHGEAFLQHCEVILADHNRKESGGINSFQDANEVGGEIELPVAGDAIVIPDEKDNNDMELPMEGQRTNLTLSSVRNTSKPCWWYFLGYPIWVRVAIKGKNGMSERLSRGNEEYDPYTTSNLSDAERDLILPNVKGYRMAMFFITFGFIAAVAGLGSNIYVIKNNIDL